MPLVYVEPISELEAVDTRATKEPACLVAAHSDRDLTNTVSKYEKVFTSHVVNPRDNKGLYLTVLSFSCQCITHARNAFTVMLCLIKIYCE